MAFANYLENKFLDHIFNKSEYEPPTIYVGLGLETDSIVTELAEIVDEVATGYDRVATTYLTWSAAVSGMVRNRLTITFPEAIADWGNVSHVMLFDSPVPGWNEILIYGDLMRIVIANEGSKPRFAIYELEINLD